MEDKKFKIEIWMYHNIVSTFKSNNIEEILIWFRQKWLICYNNGGCTFYVYENDRELSFDEIYKLGFE